LISRLSELAALYVLLLDFPKTVSNPALAMADAPPRQLARDASNKIEFNLSEREFNGGEDPPAYSAL
jgi:hypothetical protein